DEHTNAFIVVNVNVGHQHKLFQHIELDFDSHGAADVHGVADAAVFAANTGGNEARDVVPRRGAWIIPFTHGRRAEARLQVGANHLVGRPIGSHSAAIQQ